MTTWVRTTDDPEVGTVEQFIRREPDGVLVGWERYEDRSRSQERVMGYETDSQLRTRGYIEKEGRDGSCG